jgi:syntaxin-binding protein 1
VWYRSAKESDESDPTARRELVPTKLADAVYEMVSKYKSTIPNFPQSETCDLIIVDRSIDQVKIFLFTVNLSCYISLLITDESAPQVAPVIHEWTYDAMIHDLLDMDGNKYIHEV